MIIRANDANDYQCPFIVQRFVPEMLAGRNKAGPEQVKNLLACGGADCMAWRTQPEGKGYCGLVPIVPSGLVAF